MISSMICLPDDSCIVTGSFDCKLVVWDLSNAFECVQVLEENRSPVLCMDYCHYQNFIISGSMDGTMLIYKVAYQSRKSVGVSKALATDIFNGCHLISRIESKCNVLEIGFFDSGKGIFSLESDCSVKLYELKSGNLLKEFNLGGVPIVDFLVVETSKNPEKRSRPILYVLDNRNNFHKFENWFESDTVVYNMKVSSKKNKRVFTTQYTGYSPKSQILANVDCSSLIQKINHSRGPNRVFILSPDQLRRNLVVQDLD